MYQETFSVWNKGGDNTMFLWRRAKPVLVILRTIKGSVRGIDTVFVVSGGRRCGEKQSDPLRGKKRGFLVDEIDGWALQSITLYSRRVLGCVVYKPHTRGI